MNNIVIGKHALESLTTGMYSDPMVIYREYIQNAVDSIDAAVNKGIIDKNEGYVDICISILERTISIKDNGIGIDELDVEKTLISIGNSKKESSVSRGFRGIGRLAALGYCDELIFETSAEGNRKGVRLKIDSKKLTAHLLFENDKEMSAQEVLADVYELERYSENEKSHYFKVTMKGVDTGADIMQEDLVLSYLSQNAPIPYNDSTFAWGKEIKNRLRAEGYIIPEYTIFVEIGGNKKQVFKPYTDTFVVDKSKNIMDSIIDIKIVKRVSSDSTVSVLGWVAVTKYLGSISDKTIKGIRLRKGNILIGDAQTVNSAFKDARFNGWCLGEIFALDQHLIPNARRDNFEKNKSYYLLFEQLQGIAFDSTKSIRAASAQRNQAINSEEVTKEPEEKKSLVNERSVLKKKLLNTRKKIDAVTVEKEDVSTDIDFEKLDMLINAIEGSTAYKVLNTMKMSSNEKHTLEKVFNVIIAMDYERSEELINAILRVFM